MKNGPYTLVLAPLGYKGKKYREKYVYEHRLVLERKLGRLLRRGEIAHHKNENKRDNRSRNIELKTKGEHASHHHKKMALTRMICTKCGKSVNKPTSNVKYKLRTGQRFFYCDRRCMGADFGRSRKKT